MTNDVNELQRKIAELERDLALSNGRRGNTTVRAPTFTVTETEVLRRFAGNGFVSREAMDDVPRHISNIRPKLPPTIVIQTEANDGYRLLAGRNELIRLLAGDEGPLLSQRIADDMPAIAQSFPLGVTPAQLAFRFDLKVSEALPIMNWLEREGHGKLTKRGFETVFLVEERTEWKGGEHKPSKDQSLSRFGTTKPEGGVDLKVNHPALTEGRTIFPLTVVSPRETERLLVSGHNNPKLGAEVRKGPWKGFPIYHLTLEERATCPRSCALWAGCYGNAMHMARRHDHRDPDFLVSLEMELTSLSGKHPFGFAVRLHTLGDFFSADYVKFWSFMLDALPSLHVFGFTAHPSESETGKEIDALNVLFDKRSYIRFSGMREGPGSWVFDNPPPAVSADGAGVIMCPAQTGATAACATCALCWSDAAWDKCIGFLRHGMKAGRWRRRARNSVNPSIIDAKPAIITRNPGENTSTVPGKVPGRTIPTGPPRAPYVMKTPLEPPPEKPPAPPPIPFADERGVVRLTSKPKKLGISKEEQDRLIAEALKTKEVTVCPPAYADASSAQWQGVKK